MTEVKILTLRDLKKGDTFIHAKHKNEKIPVKYRVWENCQFNSAHGSSTRLCLNIPENLFQNKSCNLKVIKL